MTPITPIQLADPSLITTSNPATVLGSSSGMAGGAVFKEMFDSAVGTVDGLQAQAGVAVQRLLSGEDEDVHKPIIATEKADMSFQLFLAVRNKVISGYQALMGTQI